MIYAQESFQGHSDSGVDGPSQTDVEERIGDPVDQSIHVRVGMTS